MAVLWKKSYMHTPSVTRATSTVLTQLEQHWSSARQIEIYVTAPSYNKDAQALPVLQVYI